VEAVAAAACDMKALAAMEALAEPVDAENVQEPGALAAVAVQVAGVGQKD